MPKPSRTQKQIAERYKGNLGYYRRLHPWRRARMIVTLIALFGGLLSIFLYTTRGPEKFFNAGKISANHASFENNCDSCHDKNAARGNFRQVLSERFHRGVAFDAIDRKCETCHQQHTFHEANVVQNKSCSACHQEHQGPGPMKMVTSSQCASCHNNSQTMLASAQKGMEMNLHAQDRHLHSPQQVVFKLPRPPQGFTETFAAFSENHPDFQIKRVNARDPDVLRFNHQRHFAADIPPVNGQKLDCNYCHKPQPDGRFMQRINFAANCQACHSLQFDWRNPELRIPHGDVDLVRTFLRTLPAQYADYARLKKGLREGEVRDFVGQQIKQLRDQFHSGDELERAVFFTTNPYKPQEKSAPATRANFTGCAFCHEVKQARNLPAITKPIQVDRWMMRSDFNHAKHASVKCDDCHHATQSRDTGDVLMPAKANCVTCHSPQGKVVAECTTCHQYHAPPAAQSVATTTSWRELLAGVR
ncbi:MAG: hypothetical protein QOG48_949 [Verrucomicrobiota bacterium]|jgi:hypothetical protein